MANETTRTGGRREALENFLSPEDLVPYRAMGDKAWRSLRLRGGFGLLRHFIDWRSPRRNRGVISELMGYAWAGIYRSMLVPSIAAASFRNEGHFRPRGRIAGTDSFFGSAFRYPRSSPKLAQLVRTVNLRHHVAGVVARCGSDAEVMPHYEAAFTYVATAFIESIRRGYHSRGVPADSKEGKRLATDLCAMLYQIAGMVGLTRLPKDLAAHENFRDAYEAYLRKLPRSKWIESQAQELAKRIFPFTAAMAGNSLEDLRNRYLDRETAEYLVPDPAALEQMRPVYDEIRAEFSQRRKGYGKRLAKEFFFGPPPPEDVSDLDPLWEAYAGAPDDSVSARLVGAVLLHAMEMRRSGDRWHHPTTMNLAAGEPLIRQGQVPEYCYVLLKSSEPLVITIRDVHGEGSSEEVEIATTNAPTVLGEISMWRKTPAIATVLCRRAVELRVLRLDQRQFESLKSNPGFWTAAAATVQQRLNFSMRQINEVLGKRKSQTEDPKLAALLLLLNYVNGDSTVDLDLVPGAHQEVSLAECIDLLRKMASSLRETTKNDPALCDALEYLLQVIG